MACEYIYVIFICYYYDYQRSFGKKNIFEKYPTAGENNARLPPGGKTSDAFQRKSFRELHEIVISCVCGASVEPI